MKRVRIIFFLFLIGGVIGITAILIKEKRQPQCSPSLAVLFQELGRPIKTLDRAISRMLPIDEIDEKMLGEEIKYRLEKILKPITPDEESIVIYLNSLIEFLSRETQRSFEYKVFLVDGPPNAFAMPGGVLCVTKDLMNILENEAELAAILSHEIGHVERGHLFDAVRGEMLRRKIKMSVVFSYASDVIGMIIGLSFSKTQEDEADEYGFRMLIKKGYDPIAMSTVFEKLIQSHPHKLRKLIDPLDDFFSTHPYTQVRFDKFRARAELWKKTYPDERQYLGKKKFRDRITTFEVDDFYEKNAN